MSEEMQAASSPAEAEDPFKGEQVSMADYDKFRQDGELPERFKQAEDADPAPADPSEGEDPEPEPEPDPDDNQELKPKTAKRIAQLLAKNKELERQIAEKQDAKTESSPAPATTRQKPTADDTNPDGTAKYSTYEDFVEELADWKAEQRLESAKREQQQAEMAKAIESQRSEVRARYDDADAVIDPIITALNAAKLPPGVHEAFGTSPQFFDLCYDLGSDPEKLEKFLSLARTNPRAAVKQIFADEDRVGSQRSRGEDGKFVSKEAPKPKKTSAPKPPSPVGGPSSRAFDTSDESLSTEEWALKRNQELSRK